MIEAIDHVNIVVHDLEHLLAFSCEGGATKRLPSFHDVEGLLELCSYGPGSAS